MKPDIARAALLVLSPTLVFVAFVALAEGGRDFSAFYDLSKVTDMGDEVWVTVTLETFNHSATDAYDTTLILENQLMPGEDYGTIWAGFIGSNQSVTASGDCVVPLWVYQGWREGVPPLVRIELTDAGGGVARKFVELAFMPLVWEE